MEANIELIKEAFSKMSVEYKMDVPQYNVFCEIDSTNDFLIKIASEGKNDVTVAIALSQTNGHGRSGRSFYSPPGGNLYMSMLLNDVDISNLDLITPAGAVATARAISKSTSKEVNIKWVNDLYYDDRKVCGILAQGFELGTQNGYVVIGIGINIKENKQVPEEIRNVYGYLYDDTELDSNSNMLVIGDIAARIYYEYMRIYQNFGRIDFIEEYRRRSNVIGKIVTYVSGDEEASTEVIDIDDRGGLVTRFSDGSTKTYRDGEIRIRL